MLSDAIRTKYDILGLEEVEAFLIKFPKLVELLEEELPQVVPKFFKNYYLQLDHAWDPEYEDLYGTLIIYIITDLEVDAAMESYNQLTEKWLLKSKIYESCMNNVIIDISWHDYIKN